MPELLWLRLRWYDSQERPVSFRLRIASIGLTFPGSLSSRLAVFQGTVIRAMQSSCYGMKTESRRLHYNVELI